MVYGVIFFLGICLGSFVNALVWRLRLKRMRAGLDEPAEDDTDQAADPPLTSLDIFTSVVGEILDWLKVSFLAIRNPLRSTLSGSKKDKTGIEDVDKYSIATGRSMCPHCEHELAAKDLVPVLSWVSLGGKCRYCKKPINPQYPIVELLTGILFVVSYMRWESALDVLGVGMLALWLITITGLVALALYDAKYRYLPNEILYVVIWTALALVALATYRHGIVTLLGAAAGVAAIWGTFFIIFCLGEVMHKSLIGYGDVRLAVIIGLLVGGAINALLVIFLASVLGLLWTLLSAIVTKGHIQKIMPFGPFLITATIGVYWFGDGLVEWYLRALMP